MLNTLHQGLYKLPKLSSQVANLCENRSSTFHIGQSQNLNSFPKLLHLASDSIQGGAERVFAYTIEQTLPFYDTYVASCDNADNLPRGIKGFLKLNNWRDYPPYKGAINYIFNIQNYIALKHFLFTHKPDIIHTQNYLSSLSPSVLFALRAYKRAYPYIKLIYTQHGFGACANGGLYNYAKGRICEDCIGGFKPKIAWYNCDRRGRIYSLLKAIRSLFYQGGFLSEKTLFDKIICVGAFQYQKHVQDKWDSTKLHILQNPIDLRFYNPHIRIEDKQDVIIFYGRLSPEKNVSLLIKAFAELVKIPQFEHYKLLIIGEGDDKAHCIQLAHNLLCTHQYKFLERQTLNQIKHILASAKISVLPSLLYETFGLTIIESILGGAIPLVSAHGALQESIRNFYGKSFIFQENQNANITSLKNALVDVLLHFNQYFNELSNAAKKISHFNTAYLKGLLDIYNGGGGSRKQG